MEIGRHVRRAFGPFEIPVSKAYRRVYVDLDVFAKALCCLYRPRTIVEVGCGDGLFATCLARVFPDATILGVDIAVIAWPLVRGQPVQSGIPFRRRFDAAAWAQLRAVRPRDRCRCNSSRARHRAQRISRECA